MDCKEYTIVDMGGGRMSNMEFARGMGRFEAGIFSKLAETKKEKTAKEEEVTDLSIKAPNILPTFHIMEALCRAAAESSNCVYVISDRGGLLGAVRGRYSIRYGVELDSEIEICSLLGSREGLAYIAPSIVDEGGVVLAPDPHYPVFGDGPQIAGTKPHYMPQRKENKYTIHLDEILEGTARKAKLTVVSCPNNPTTVMAPGSFYGELIDFARKYDIIVLRDNAYSDLVFDERGCGSFLRFPGVKEIDVEFNSLSKTYGLAGVRIGFRLGNSQVALCLELLKSNMDYGMLLPVQTVAITAATGDQPCVQATKQAYETRRNIMYGGFTSIGQRVKRSETIMPVQAAIPEHYTTSKAFVMELVGRAGIMITPGSAFGPSGEGYVRPALVQDKKMLNKAIRVVGESGTLLEEGKR